jgi:CheY-like chemotaxis protein
LRGYGYNVFEASSGEQANGVLAEHHESIGLLLTDAVLPGLNGREIAESARELRPDLPVLYMSGYAASTLGKQGVLDPGEVLLHKPFTATELARKVREVLDGGPSRPQSTS